MMAQRGSSMDKPAKGVRICVLFPLHKQLCPHNTRFVTMILENRSFADCTVLHPIGKGNKPSTCHNECIERMLLSVTFNV